METELATRQAIALTPAEVVENASIQAKLLMDIVEKTGCFQLIAKKKYLQVEAWETIGAFNRVHAVVESVNPIIKEGETIGYQAMVNLMKGGEVVGGAIMPAFFTGSCCKGKEGDAKHNAAMSAAQTYATSKAYRMNFSYIAILAGYEPTPAEEMTGTDTLGGVKTETEHFCKLHNTAFFKKGKMKGYAHPIGDTGEWCNETEVQNIPEETGDDVVVIDNEKPTSITVEQRVEIQRLAKGRGITEEQLNAYCLSKFKADVVMNLTFTQAAGLIASLKLPPKAKAQATETMKEG